MNFDLEKINDEFVNVMDSPAAFWANWVKNGGELLTVICIDRDGDEHVLHFNRESPKNPLLKDALEYIFKNYEVDGIGVNDTVWMLKKY